MSAELPKMPEPVAWKTTYHGVCIPLTESKELAQHWRGYGWKVAEYYTAAQMHTFAQEAARQAMERCADIAFQKAARVNSSWIATDIARDIRALIPQDPDHLAGVGNMVRRQGPIGGKTWLSTSP